MITSDISIYAYESSFDSHAFLIVLPSPWFFSLSHALSLYKLLIMTMFFFIYSNQNHSFNIERYHCIWNIRHEYSTIIWNINERATAKNSHDHYKSRSESKSCHFPLERHKLDFFVYELFKHKVCYTPVYLQPLKYAQFISFRLKFRRLDRILLRFRVANFGMCREHFDCFIVRW